MKKRTILFTIGLLLVLFSIAFSTLVLLVKNVPTYYSRLELPDTPIRRELSGECVSKMSDLLNDIENGEAKWGIEFTAEQLNSFFQQDFLTSLGAEGYLPPGMSEPRILIEDDRMKIGIRYGSGFWSSVISLEVRLWLVANETNMIALELNDLRAGGMPISPTILLDRVTEALRNANMAVTWYRHEGKPVAIIQYQADQLLPTLILQRLECVDGRLAISGSSTDANLKRTSLKANEK
jgi:hypothetical protein